MSEDKQAGESADNGKIDIDRMMKLGSGFQFGKSIVLSQDLTNSEFRFLTLGWLDHAHKLMSRNASLQEFRDVIQRLAMLTERMSAYQFRLLEQEKQAMRNAEDLDKAPETAE